MTLLDEMNERFFEENFFDNDDNVSKLMEIISKRNDGTQFCTFCKDDRDYKFYMIIAKKTPTIKIYRIYFCMAVAKNFIMHMMSYHDCNSDHHPVHSKDKIGLCNDVYPILMKERSMKELSKSYDCLTIEPSDFGEICEKKNVHAATISNRSPEKRRSIWNIFKPSSSSVTPRKSNTI